MKRATDLAIGGDGQAGEALDVGVRAYRAKRIDDDPSLHVYPDPTRGWYCYGCRRGGSVYDFAGLLWKVTPRGDGFLELRRRLAAAMGMPGATRIAG